MRVRRGRRGLEILVFDWETAGWGLPVADLVKCPDPEIYRAVVQKHWPGQDLTKLDRLLAVGVLFRTAAGIHWETSRLAYQWLERPRLTLRIYHERLADALRVMGVD